MSLNNYLYEVHSTWYLMIHNIQSAIDDMWLLADDCRYVFIERIGTVMDVDDWWLTYKLPMTHPLSVVWCCLRLFVMYWWSYDVSCPLGKWLCVADLVKIMCCKYII